MRRRNPANRRCGREAAKVSPCGDGCWRVLTGTARGDLSFFCPGAGARKGPQDPGRPPQDQARQRRGGSGLSGGRKAPRRPRGEGPGLQPQAGRGAPRNHRARGRRGLARRPREAMEPGGADGEPRRRPGGQRNQHCTATRADGRRAARAGAELHPRAVHFARHGGRLRLARPRARAWRRPPKLSRAHHADLAPSDQGGVARGEDAGVEQPRAVRGVAQRLAAARQPGARAGRAARPHRPSHPGGAARRG